MGNQVESPRPNSFPVYGVKNQRSMSYALDGAFLVGDGSLQF